MAKMNFGPADRVRKIISNMEDSYTDLSKDRALVNGLFNGDPPYTKEEAEENNVEINANFLQGSTIAMNARGQCYSAFLKPGAYFTVKIDMKDKAKKLKCEKIVNRHLTKITKDSRAFLEQERAVLANVVLHGPGPCAWSDRHGWVPNAVAVDDLLIPQDTFADLSNLTYFSIRHKLTPAALYKMSRIGRDWDMDCVNKILADVIQEIEGGDTDKQENLWDKPEKMSEAFRQHMGVYGTDSVPAIKCFSFFYVDPETGKWYRNILLDVPTKRVSTDEYIFEGTSPFADSLDQMLHVQVGDFANVAPFKYHSIRSLGQLLYSSLEIQNRQICKLIEQSFRDLTPLLRVPSNVDEDTLGRIDLSDHGIIPDTVQFVPRDQRHMPDPTLTLASMTMNQRFVSEGSRSFTSDPGNAGQKMSATQSNNESAQASQFVGAMLGMLYTMQEFKYREICRRFCIKGSTSDDVKKFRKNCIQDGVSEEALDFSRWTVRAVRVLGQGNKVQEVAQANALMAVRNALNPSSQAVVLNRYIEANTDDDGLADQLSPIDSPTSPGNSMYESQQDALLLLSAFPVPIRDGVSRGEYTSGLIHMLDIAVNKVNAGGKVPRDMEQFIGMGMLSKYCGENLAILQQDAAQKQLVKMLADTLKKLNNDLRAFGQRLQEKQQSNNEQSDPETMAEIQKDLMVMQHKLQTKAQIHQQKMMEKQQSFMSAEQRKQQQFELEQKRKIAETGLDLTTQAAKDRQELQHADIATAAEIMRDGAKDRAGSQPE